MAEFDERNADNTGLLIRLKALHRIGGRDAMLQWAHVLLWATFTCIELLPVLVKLFRTSAAGAYERVQQIQDDGDADVFEDQMDAWKDLQRERAQVGVDVERDRLEREKAQGIVINQTVHGVQTKVVEDALAVWARHAQLQAQVQRDQLERDFARQRATTSPPTYVHPAPKALVSGVAGAPTRTPQPAQSPRNGAAVNTYLQTAQLPDEGVL